MNLDLQSDPTHNGFVLHFGQRARIKSLDKEDNSDPLRRHDWTHTSRKSQHNLEVKNPKKENLTGE